MLHQLAQPYKGQTHVAIETEHAAHRSFITNTLRFGTLAEDGSLDVAFSVHRTWALGEYEAFLASVVERGLPANMIGNFRTDDLAAWLYANGWATSTWAPPAPPEEDAPEEEPAAEEAAAE